MNLLGKIGIWGLVVGATGSALHADPTGGWLSPNGVSAGATTTTAPTDVVRPGVTLSAADLQTRVHLLHEQTRANAHHVQYLQQVARKEKDVIKLNCVNDKLVQIKPQMNLADAAESELGGATEANRMAIFESLSQAADSIRQLREEADQCIGEPTTQGGESSNSYTAPKAPDDPTKTNGFGGGELEPPGYASPYN